MTYWLSYGGGVNSTALAILLAEGKLPQYEPWEAIFADTRDEKPETYEYVEKVFIPYLAERRKILHWVKGEEGVLQRWERLKVTGSRILRTCTHHAKVDPIHHFLLMRAENGDAQLIGIDADQPWRARPPHPQDKWEKLYPLVDMKIDRTGCEQIIRDAGLPVPLKSGCWHCPFMRVGEVMDLAINEPDRFNRIEQLEKIATEAHGPTEDGSPRSQWGNHPAEYWRERAKKREEIRKIEGSQLTMFCSEQESESPCECYDG